MKRGLLVANLLGWSLIALVGWSRLPPATPTTPATPATDAAIERVRQEVAYTSQISDLPHEELVALAVNSYVVGHVSAPAYGYLAASGIDMEDWTIEQVLTAGAGICGEASSVAEGLYSEMGVETRRLVAWYPEGGHTTVEVWYDGDWHWLDPTWGMFYTAPDGDIYALTETLRLTPSKRAAAVVTNESRLWTQVTRLAGPDAVLRTGLGFLDAEKLRIEVGSRVIFDR
jgi:hypothetical protein